MQQQFGFWMETAAGPAGELPSSVRMAAAIGVDPTGRITFEAMADILLRSTRCCIDQEGMPS